MYAQHTYSYGYMWLVHGNEWNDESESGVNVGTRYLFLCAAALCIYYKHVLFLYVRV